MSGLAIADVRKAFGELAVLRGLNLEVKGGSFVAILGPSGSGKTTLLRIIAGFERADSGEVRLGDLVVDDGEHFVPPDRRRIGYVPQEGSLFPHLSVEENVGFGLPRRERRGRRVQELLAMVGLAEVGRRFPHQLSGGQQQRVALARALAIRPELVLLDEPFSSLDASLRASVRADVRKVIRDAGATALLVTHDQDEALSLADQVAVIRDGVIGQVDTPQGLYLHPSNPELARSLGQSNFLTGHAHGATVGTSLGELTLEERGAGNRGSLLVLIRPEQIELVSESSGDELRGRVVDVEFYGHDAVVRVQPDDSAVAPLTVRTADALSTPSVGTDVGLRVRGTVVGWRQEDLSPPLAGVR